MALIITVHQGAGLLAIAAASLVCLLGVVWLRDRHGHRRPWMTAAVALATAVGTYMACAQLLRASGSFDVEVVRVSG
jgi:NhaP-type Na+/H+ or K+/H+ antiporter